MDLHCLTKVINFIKINPTLHPIKIRIKALNFVIQLICNFLQSFQKYLQCEQMRSNLFRVEKDGIIISLFPMK